MGVIQFLCIPEQSFIWHIDTHRVTTAQVVLKRSFLIKTAFVLATGSIGSVYEAIREGFVGGCEGVDWGAGRLWGMGAAQG